MDCTVTTSTESTHEFSSLWWLDLAYAERMENESKRECAHIWWLGWQNTSCGSPLLTTLAWDPQVPHGSSTRHSGVPLALC